MTVRSLCWALSLLGPVAEAAGADTPSAAAFLVQPYLQLPTPTGMTVMWETNRALRGQVEYGLTRGLGQVAEERTATVLHEVRLIGLKSGTPYFYRVRSGPLVSEVFSFKSAPPPGTRRWRMALYGDSRSNPAIHRKVAEEIAKAHVDLVVHTGDIVANGKNHDSWRREFFEPLSALGRSVPWVSTIGNHERDSDNYFSYTAQPGSKHYYGLDFANAHFICLDSNAWIEKGRDSEQYSWLAAHLRAKRDATWTFVVFHHPLFSAHATRPINPLRWEWAPLLLDPANRVDGVLTGHDHFYARNYRMGRVSNKPQPGVLFLTSAGGGASLYRTKLRDYVAVARSVHHFTLFEFEDDRVVISAIGVAGGIGPSIRTGEVFDRYVLTKQPAPPEEFCAYEVEEFRRHLRQALAAMPATALRAGRPADRSEKELSVPTRFRVPMSGFLSWESHTLVERIPFGVLAPGDPLKFYLDGRVPAGPSERTPKLTIEFEKGHFRNRSVEAYPLKLTGPERVAVGLAKSAPTIDGRLEAVWNAGPAVGLIGYPPLGGRADAVRLLADRDFLYVGARLDDPDGEVRVKPADPSAEGSSFVLSQPHFRLETWDGKQHRTFALTPDHRRYCSCDDDDDETTPWRAAAAQQGKAWSVELAIPRRLFPELGKVRINLVHRRRIEKEFVDFQLRPTYKPGSDPDRIPDWKSAEDVENFARLTLEGS